MCGVAGSRHPGERKPMLSSGDYLLEGIWDVENEFSAERDKSNNRAFVSVSVPTFTSSTSQAVCQSDNDSDTPDEIVDCVTNPGHPKCLHDYMNAADGNECPGDLIPFDRLCYLDCRNGESCPSNMQCAGTVCRIPCISNGDCPGRMICDSGDDFCAKPENPEGQP